MNDPAETIRTNEDELTTEEKQAQVDQADQSITELLDYMKSQKDRAAQSRDRLMEL
ncbi:hypothetical protein KKA95_05075 [Patescibacteria group bacterium]|nr:hypothetical protein [Patescibacteria group bacterium]